MGDAEEAEAPRVRAGWNRRTWRPAWSEREAWRMERRMESAGRPRTRAWVRLAAVSPAEMGSPGAGLLLGREWLGHAQSPTAL